MIRVGDMVQPKPEWVGDPNNVPSGRVVRVDPFDSCALYVEGERRAFASYVFELIEASEGSSVQA